MLVIDTNILISAMLKDSTTREIIVKGDLEILYPAFLLDEVMKYKDYIIKNILLLLFLLIVISNIRQFHLYNN